MGTLTGGLSDRPRRYAATDRTTESWHTPLVRPAVAAGAAAPSRTADTLDLRVAEFVDADGHAGVDNRSEEQDTVTRRVSRDGQPIADLSAGWAPVPTTAGPARYRLDVTTARSSAQWRWATRTETASEFTSARPSGDAARPLPLLQVDYRVPADLRGEVPGRRKHAVGLTLRHPAGLPAPAGTTVRAEVSRRRTHLAHGARTRLRHPVHRRGAGRARHGVAARLGAGPVRQHRDADRDRRVRAAVRRRGGAVLGPSRPGPGQIQPRRAAWNASPGRVSTPAAAIRSAGRCCTVRRLTPSCDAIDLSGTPATNSDSSRASSPSGW
ncbi:hypothetical protein O7622_15280 [Micromonospora sp. WMMD1076]|uniref:hypothetical protein n=1 Tax=Micromonospora sp. WMMD1076 TaxID=3016103 RepID=UPI00249C74A3|nr:hypothetical protein [Micromonospora sp. WMMD1076]WFF09817.1 hypothetical protein O7622_15280 [Micromonospora sp. WMMD1076]